MKTYLSQVINSNEKGFFIVRQPTGSGKSFSVEEVIKEHLKNKSDTRKIIYLTSLKKNLPKSFVESNDVLLLRSNVDQVIDKLAQLYVPEIFKTQAYYNTLRLVEKLNNLKNNKIFDKEYIKSVEKELFDSETAFRHELRIHLKNTFNSKEI